ncbi:4086_t:CDS:2 [Gigaspora margarita]|uniref:4086_t:CDS:1 n=1 Tax=Gigaspora margarita TaxID=4874 RepID=A0ABN7VT10_GIGMA|nr:4086_t:CDS:2 [Gigaspora margarita]
MTSSISYTDLFQKITDCALPSKETLDTLSTKNADIDIPTIQPSKRNKTQSSKLKLSALLTWSQLGYTARQSWIEDSYSNELPKKFQINKENTSYRFETELNEKQDYIDNLEYEDYINSVSSTYGASVLSNYSLPTSSGSIISDEYNDSISDNYIGSAPESDSEAIKNQTTQKFQKISSRTWQKINDIISENGIVPASDSDNEEADENRIFQNSEVDVNPKKHNQRSENPLPNQVRKENTVLSLQLTIHNILQRIQKAKIGSKPR